MATTVYEREIGSGEFITPSWDNQKADATFAASGFLKRMCGRF